MRGFSSALAWLDSDEAHRRRALDVIDLFSVRDTRDELGLASVRDAWADRFAPGTSTIQTRARYFLLVPWVYRDLERRGVKREAVERRARRAETRIIESLRAAREEGTIGGVAGERLQRLPSSIYWHGLGVFRIRLFEGSMERYHATFGTRRGEPDEEGRSGSWHPHLPEPPEGFPEVATLELRREEAEFLREQVVQHAPRSLFAFLVLQEPGAEEVDFAWEHEHLARMPGELRGWVGHARRFAVVVQGAALLYNLMLGERSENEERVAHYGSRLREWAAEVRVLEGDLRSWDRLGFWELTRQENPRVPPPTRKFAEEWIELVLSAGPEAVPDSASARELVERREVALKRNRSRLRHREHLERWNGAAGTARMSFRWPIMQRLVKDIHEGLQRD